MVCGSISYKREKGLLWDKDKTIRLRHARSVKNVLNFYPDFDKKTLRFLLRVSLIHKFNPMSDAYRKRSVCGEAAEKD